MVAKTTSSKKSKAAKRLKAPETGKEVSMPSKAVQKEKDRLKTGLNPALVEKAVEALVKHHQGQNEDKLSLLGNDESIQLQITLLRAPGKGSPKPVRILIPHPLYQLADNDDNHQLEEPEICLIVKEESKPWCQEMIEKFPEHMGCVKKVLGLQSLRKKHARYEQRRELLNKYNFFLADDRILPMLSKALGSDFFKAKKLPIPITLTRKEALPFAVQKALSATYMTLSRGTCVMIRSGTTAMSTKNVAENIVEIVANAIPKLPHKWANIQNISVKTPQSISLPIYTKSPEVLRELAVMAGLTEDIDTPQEELDVEKPKKSQDEEKPKKREMKSPLLRALKKQKKEENEKRTKEEKESSETPKSKKTVAKEAKESTPKSAKKKQDAKTETPKSDKKSSKTKKSDEEGEKKQFIAAKKFKGSKKGYIFKMGRQGLGYYVDVVPVVDRMAMEALLRSSKSNSRRGGQKKNKYKGTRRF